MSARSPRVLHLALAGSPGVGSVEPPPVPLATLEVAGTFLARFLGLMGRRSLAPGWGLWLPGATGIHMLWMRFAIDAVFLSRPDEAGARTILALRRALRPWAGVVWYVHRADGVIELPVGSIDAWGLAPGGRVALVKPDLAV